MKLLNLVGVVGIPEVLHGLVEHQVREPRALSENSASFRALSALSVEEMFVFAHPNMSEYKYHLQKKELLLSICKPEYSAEK